MSATEVIKIMHSISLLRNFIITEISLCKNPNC